MYISCTKIPKWMVQRGCEVCFSSLFFFNIGWCLSIRYKPRSANFEVLVGNFLDFVSLALFYQAEGLEV